MPRTLLQLSEDFELKLEDSGLFFGHGTDNPFDEAVWMVCHAAGVDLAEVDETPWSLELTDEAEQAARALLQKRIESKKPLAYLINEAWFAGHRFYIDERAIVPRSHLGEWIPERFEPWLMDPDPENILDLCTGGGCIALSLALAFEGANVRGTDLSADALEVARTNAKRMELENRVTFGQGDLFEAAGAQKYDLIVSNPPYVADDLMRDLPEEYEFEPHMAFAGGSTGLDLVDRMLAEARDHLTDDGVLIVEVGSANQALEQRYGNVPFTWLSSENGDAVIFMLTAAELDRYFPDGQL